ncbi:MAG: ISKra4 family transposase [Deltaproteobacteria bacterium]|nr:ISKra4 family transposase [Deltaproteobacteria bacterium]
MYLETKWDSLIPCAKVVDLLKDVLPVAETLNQETVRNHLHATATKMEQALGEEKECLFEGTEDEWAAQPTPDGPMTVGIDGGFVRARRKAGFFEVIAGKSIVAFRRTEAQDIPSAKRFGFVQTYDTKPRRRLWELLKSQGMQENQAVLFLSDGGETVCKLQAYLHPSSDHLIDWFHVAMKLTVLQRQNKAFLEENPEDGKLVTKTLERVKHYLWHGNVDKALESLGLLLFDLEVQRRRFPAAAKLDRGITEFDTYIRNNQKFIPNLGERYRQGDIISTAFVESTINQVVSKRLVKRQQMQWTLKGAHLLLQTRTKVLDGDLAGVFRGWYPQFRPAPATSPTS